MTMKRLKTFIVLTFLILTSVGCDSNSNVTGNEGRRNEGRKIEGKGDIVAQTVSLPSFTSISNTIPANINVTVGSPQKIVLKAQQNILDEMVLKVEDFQLRLDFQDDVTRIASNGIEVDITVAEINKITSTGVGNIFLSGPKQNDISINISGVVNVEAYDLEVDTCSIDMAGVANCKVKVNNLLNVALTGSGIVFYRGNPIVNATNLGTGNVINDN